MITTEQWAAIVRAIIREGYTRTRADVRNSARTGALQRRTAQLLRGVTEALGEWERVDSRTGMMMVEHYGRVRQLVEQRLAAAEAGVIADWAGAMESWWDIGVDSVELPGIRARILATQLDVDRGRLELADRLLPEMIQDVTRGTVSDIGRVLSTSTQMGLPRPAVTRRLREVLIGNPARHNLRRFGGWAYQCERIYRTETATIRAAAQTEAARAWSETLGQPLVKVWQHDRSPSRMARASHVALHGQQRELDEPYSNGYDRPHAPEMPASQRINCMCYQLIIPADIAAESPQYRRRAPAAVRSAARRG
jgi:Phage Mu protein F like protein